MSQKSGLESGMTSSSKSPADALVLSVFPGIDLLGRAFEEHGLCVVRGPDLITGGDIRSFHPPRGKFSGLIGGPPCQDFSRLNRHPGDYGALMLDEFARVIAAAEPDWFLFENVIHAPDVTVPGYSQQRFMLDLAWFSEFSRRRDFIFGSRSGRFLNPKISATGETQGTAVTGNDERSFPACCEIQGLPASFDVPFFTLDGKKQAVANAVPMAMGRYVAELIATTYYGIDATTTPEQAANDECRRCKCGCGRVVVGRASYSGPTCRKRAQRARDVAA